MPETSTRCWCEVMGRCGGGGRRRVRGDGKHDGGEFCSIEVALIAVIEDNVPDELVVCGDVMVCDHAVEPQAAELHLDVASDEGMMRGWWVLRVGKSRN